MFDALITTASPRSIDAAHGLIRSFLDHHPEVPVYLVTTGDLSLPESLATQVFRVPDLEQELGLAITAALDPDNRTLFALPFFLERVLEQHESALYLAPSCLVTGPARTLSDAVDRHPVVLVSPFVAEERHSTTPRLVHLTRREDLISPRIVGVRREAHKEVKDWQSTMTEGFFDVFQRTPSQLMPGILGTLLGVEGAGLIRGDVLASWVDFAAIESGRGLGPIPSIITADELWELGRQAVRRDEEGETEVAWQLLADRVHDSRPLEGLMELVTQSTQAHPVEEDTFTLFHSFVAEARRAADPTGARWPPESDPAEFQRWLYETNANGLTRIAHLYWQVRTDLHNDIPEPQLDPTRLRTWNDRYALAEFGMDLFDPTVTPRKPTQDDEVLIPLGERLSTAVLWRWNLLKLLVPAYAARQQAREDPGIRRGVAPPRRVEVRRDPPLYGTSPRSLSVLGCFRAESGLGQAARASLDALRLLGRDFSYIDTSEEYPSRNAVDPGLSQETFGAFGDVNLIHSNADELLTLSGRVFRHRLAGRFNAAMWFWEAADLPERSRAAFDVVDELWLASEYLADVFGQYGKVPVKVIGLAADLPEMPEASRRDFGLSDDEFLFLFVYDALSSHGRKNPEKALEAFVRAFAPEFRDVRFVLKVSNLNKFPASQRRIKSMAEQYPAITLIDEYWPRSRVLELMAVADVYVSLHAAEGFGLTLLEAMALGSPVICTGYSGNMDFTTSENSWLVDYRMIAIEEETGPYPEGSVWASPSVDSAADLMRMAYDHPAEVERKRQRAIVDARETASLERYATRLDAELRRLL